MELKEIKKYGGGRFIRRFDLVYTMKSGNEKVYEMISRKKDMDSLDDLKNESPDAVVIIAFDESGEKLLLNREFRLAVGDFIYNFPAGLIDPGETPEVSAVRELREETGLELYIISDILGLSYGAVGFSNESTVTVIGKARGSFAESTSEQEEITPYWVSRDELKELLKKEKFAARTQSFCYLWANGGKI